MKKYGRPQDDSDRFVSAKLPFLGYYRRYQYSCLLYTSYQLGICYEEGIGLEQDLSAAGYWFQEAARRFYEAAQVGNCLLYTSRNWHESISCASSGTS